MLRVDAIFIVQQNNRTKRQRTAQHKLTQMDMRMRQGFDKKGMSHHYCLLFSFLSIHLLDKEIAPPTFYMHYIAHAYV